jgi:hypothetical protein
MASLVIPSDESARGFGGTDNSRAVGSLTCGIAGSAIPPFGIILGTVAIALGASASKRIRTDPGRFGGKGMATGGIILGIVALVLGVFALVVFLVQVIK